MHSTAWRLINEFLEDALPTWDVSMTKTAQGQVSLEGSGKFRQTNQFAVFYFPYVTPKESWQTDCLPTL